MKVIDIFEYDKAEMLKRYRLWHGYPTYMKWYWRPENVTVGDGLKIHTRREAYTMEGITKQITTGRVETVWEDFVEGYMRWVVSTPVFPLAWHSCWCYSERTTLDWPKNEIDVFEQMLDGPLRAQVNFHAGGNPNASKQWGKTITLNSPLSALHEYVYERTAQSMTIWWDGKEVAKLLKSSFNATIQAAWLAPQCASMVGQVRGNMDQIPAIPANTFMHVTEFEYEKAGVFSPAPGPIEQPEPTPTPQPGGPMDITFKAAADEAARPNDWHLFWTLTGAPSKTVKLVVFNADTGKRLPFVTTGLAHVYVPKAWKDFEYWLEENNTIITNPIRVALPPLPPTEPPTNNKADLAAALAYTRALSTNLRHNADQADLMVGILEKVVERLP